MQYWYCKNTTKKYEAVCWAHKQEYAEGLFLRWLEQQGIYNEEVTAEPFISFEHGLLEYYDIIA
jgi:hypothetical protein